MEHVFGTGASEVQAKLNAHEERTNIFDEAQYVGEGQHDRDVLSTCVEEAAAGEALVVGRHPGQVEVLPEDGAIQARPVSHIGSGE